MRAAHEGQLELADHADAFGGHAVGGLPGRNAVALGDLEDLGDVVVDRAGHALGAFAVVAFEFDRDVHQAAGVDRVVGGVDDAAAFQFVAALVGGELVVGRTAHDLELEAGDGLLVDGGTQRGRRVNIGVDVVDFLGAHGFAAHVDGGLDGFFVDVGDEDLGVFLAQQLDELHADVPHALHGVAVLADFLVAELTLQTGADALERAEGGERRGIARAAVDLVHADGVVGFLEDVFHVVDVDTDVFGRDVAAVQRIDETAHGAEQRFGLVLARVADDDGLAAAQVQAGNRRLVGHAARQAQNVVEGILLGGVGPHAHATQGRSERGVVNGDDGLEPGILVVTEDDLLVLGRVDGFKQIH